jgi:hypothetical protein
MKTNHPNSIQALFSYVEGMRQVLTSDPCGAWAKIKDFA